MPNLKKIRIGAGAGGFNFLPIFIAQEKGLFSKYGIDVDIVRTGTTDKATTALKEGKMDIAFTPPEGAIRNYVDGGPLRIIGGNLTKLPLTLVAHPRFKKIEDLKGARLGTSSMTEGTALYTMNILAQHGLQYPGDYGFDLVGIHTARAAALEAETLDAAVQLVPSQFELIDKGFTNLAEARDYIPDILFIAMIVENSWANSNREDLINILKALHEAISIMTDTANGALCWELLGNVIKSELQYVKQSLNLVLENHMMPSDFSIPVAAINTSIELMQKAGLLEENHEIEPAGVIDNSYRLEALSQRG